MASAASDWLKQDKRRMLHAVYRVGDMQARRPPPLGVLRAHVGCGGRKRPPPSAPANGPPATHRATTAPCPRARKAGRPRGPPPSPRRRPSTRCGAATPPPSRKPVPQKHIDWYTKLLGMKLLRYRDIPEARGSKRLVPSWPGALHRPDAPPR